MRILLDIGYLLSLLVLSPLIAVRALFSERWRAGWGQRFGRCPASEGAGPGVWVHAASVGEINTARTLVEAMRRQHPDWRVALSTNTNTGYQVARDRLDAGVTRLYFPLDVSFILGRVWRRLRPDVIVLVEGEFWPNLLRAARRRGVPVVVVNGRMTEKVAKTHRRFRFLYSPLHDPATRNLYCVQNETYAERYRQAGFPAGRIRITGTMKYDVVSTQADPTRLDGLRRSLGLTPDETLWIGACTWPGEEALCLDAHRRLLRDRPSLRLLLAPRHVERADQVRREIEAAGFPCLRRSTAPAQPPRGAVLLLDTAGELATAYALGTVAFVGKSLTAEGGHNVLEPAALGVPAVFGPRVSNFEDECRLLLDAQAAALVRDGEGLYNAVLRFIGDPALARMAGDAGRQAVLSRRGATERHLQAIAEVLERTRAPAAGQGNGKD